MYGIKFRGHPDLRRILMYEEFIGHPLRKDYPKERSATPPRCAADLMPPPDPRTGQFKRMTRCRLRTQLVTRKMVLGVREAEDLNDLDGRRRDADRAHDDQHGPVAPGDARHGPHGADPRRRDASRTATSQVGYLHRCFEKESEYATYTQVFPYTDRLNYVSPMLNNVGYAIAVEKLLGITERIPERAQYIRVIVGEISRITDHLTCVGASAMELGAFTPFLWLIKAREWLWDLQEQISGARLTHSYVRVGGVAYDLTPDFAERLRDHPAPR